MSGPAVIQVTQRSAFEKFSAQTSSMLKLLQRVVLPVRRGQTLLQEVSEEAADGGLHLIKIIRRRKRRTEAHARRPFNGIYEMPLMLIKKMKSRSSLIHAMSHQGGVG